ncbi:MAG: O-antigen ligase family protein [Patescibacteria group bacterium]
MDILKIFFLLIIPLSFLLSQIVRVQLGNGLSLNILDITVGFAVIIMFIQSILEKKLHLFLKDNIRKGILIFIGVAVLSLTLNSPSLSLQQFIISGLYILRWIAYAFLFLLIKEYGIKDKKRIQHAMLTTGVLFIIFGFIQFSYYNDLVNLFYLGWDEHKYRLFSTFLDPNFSGIFLVLFLLFIVGKRLEKQQKALTKIKLLLSVLFALAAGALILTFSRGAFVMLFFSFAVFFLLIGKKQWIIIMIGIMLITGIVLSRRFYIESVNPFRTFSSNARLISMGQALEMFYKHPVLGVGFNSYRYAQLRLGFRKQINIERSHADSGSDNSFLFILATTGIVGFTAYLSMLSAILLRVYRVFREKKSTYSAAVFSSIIGLCVASIFTNALFFPPLMLWTWVMLGVTEKN